MFGHIRCRDVKDRIARSTVRKECPWSQQRHSRQVHTVVAAGWPVAFIAMISNWPKGSETMPAKFVSAAVALYLSISTLLFQCSHTRNLHVIWSQPSFFSIGTLHPWPGHLFVTLSISCDELSFSFWCRWLASYCEQVCPLCHDLE